MTVRTRFAPSPTGHVHVGNARTALFSALLAAKERGQFILRIEDTDAARSDRAFEEGLKADLGWLGLRWQEGPDEGGPQGPYRQSERSSVYEEYLKQLADKRRVYPCFCSARELELARKAQLAAGQPPRYAGTCAALTTEEIEARVAKGLKPALRFRVPEQGETDFDDLIRGRQVFAHRDIGDFIIRRADGSPAFFFSNALDDALMGMTHVLRGEDHLANTPRQLLLLAALGLPAPRYAHLSLVVGQGGAPLSKREGGGSLQELRAEGILPEALLNYLARLGHTYTSNEFMGFKALAEDFDLARLGHSPAHFDHAQLEHWQKEALRHADEPSLWRWMAEGGRGLDERVPVSERSAFVSAVRGNVLRPRDAALWAEVVYGAPGVPEGEAADALRKAGPGFFEAALGVLRTQAPEFKPYAQAVGKAAGVSGKALFMPLRVALTGRLDGPEMDRLWKLLPAKSIEARLKQALSHSR
ncbi:MAG TPA: glutamate--tRNA ligase [Gammaproteobacteria bacterium]|nr:glutamate--tRNA ligase [Gammaproteobacteria bacterium]